MSTCHTIEPGPKPAPLKGQLASTMPNMILSLSIICALMAALLAGIYLVTKPTIDQIGIIREQAAVKAVLPEFDTAEAVAGSEKNVTIYRAVKDGQLSGVAVKTFSDKGYAKRIILMVGFTPAGVMRDLRVMEQGETPGLGTKMTEASFQKQFLDKDPASFKLEVKKDGGDVDAITAATISSRAFCDALNRAYKAFGGIAQ